MKNQTLLAASAALLLLSANLSHSAINVPLPAGKVAPAVALKVEPFDLAAVQLLDSPFKQAMERDRTYLLQLNPDRLLHNFRTNAGLEAKAPLYGGWESQGVAGHILGHYLSALSLQYRATDDPLIKARVYYIVDELALCQEKNGNGYVSAIPDGKAMFADVAAGKADGLQRGWVPWYTMHKLFAGLRDAYLYTGNAKAKDVLIKLSDWAIDTTSHLSDEQWQVMLTQEHGGMNEVLADVYGFTGEQKYLDLSHKFYQKSVLNPLGQQEDHLAGLHGNTQIPKLIGLARLYELTGTPQDRTAAEYFWDRVVHTRTYAIGGDTENEHFGLPDELSQHLGPVTAETCNTYNMLKLTRHLFEWNPTVGYADFYERALYNHILASQDPKRGMFTYYVSLKPGHFKTYSTPEDSFWCCVGTGMENHTKYGDSIYFHDANSLYVNLFIPSILNWQAKGLTVRQDTRFPESDTTRLTFSCAKRVMATIKVRYPAWTNNMTLSINGQKQKITAQAGTYATVQRAWKNGDTLDITLPMSLHTESLPDDPHKVAIFYGPIVLAGQLGTDGLNPPIPYAADAGAYFHVSDPPVPVLVAAGKPLNSWLKPVAGQPLTFKTVGVGHPNDVTLKPFYSTYYDRYTVYWDTFDEAGWQQHEADYKAEQERLRALDARTVDEMRSGEQQSEVDHKLKSEKSRTGDWILDKHWRDAADGGWFSFELKVLPDTPQDLVCTYWGADSGNRNFDILVDGTVVATESLNGGKAQYVDKTYPLPAALLVGKKQVTVRLQAKPGNIAGGIFDCRILRRQ